MVLNQQQGLPKKTTRVQNAMVRGTPQPWACCRGLNCFSMATTKTFFSQKRWILNGFHFSTSWVHANHRPGCTGFCAWTFPGKKALWKIIINAHMYTYIHIQEREDGSSAGTCDSPMSYTLSESTVALRAVVTRAPCRGSVAV